MFYKSEHPFTDDQLLAADEKFRDVDARVKTDFTGIDLKAVKAHFMSLLPDVDKVFPEHCSGSTVETNKNWEKIRLDGYPQTLLRSSKLAPHRLGTNDRIRSLRLVRTPPAKITHIPKDARGPRTIAIQPAHLLMFQRGLMEELYEYIETSSPASGYINFTDQSINKKLAYIGSFDQSYCTIDLKDASDMVSNNLITALTDGHEWQDLLYGTRASQAYLPILKENITLNKFASMGSALCFPIEAMLFWSIARTVSKEVYVYGDDIIVPNQDYDVVCSELERFGLIVNRSKSFHTGFFRESCGGDFYQSHDVTYIRFKSVDHPSWLAFVKNLTDAHFITRAHGEMILREYQETTGRPVVFTQGESTISGAFRVDGFTRGKYRWNKDIQCLQTRALLPTLDVMETTKDQYGYSDWLRRHEKERELSRLQVNLDYLTDSRSQYAVPGKPKYGWVSI